MTKTLRRRRRQEMSGVVGEGARRFRQQTTWGGGVFLDDLSASRPIPSDHELSAAPAARGGRQLTWPAVSSLPPPLLVVVAVVAFNRGSRSGREALSPKEGGGAYHEG